jgi:hypothetical protein
MFPDRHSEQKTLQGLIDDNETKDRNFNVFTLLQAIGSQQYTLNTAAVSNMIKPLERGEASGLTSHKADSGVGEGDVASYAVVQYLEKVGDGLTGDHQPSGAAVKEALRQALHLSKQGPLTRGNARNAYKRAITIVVTEAWHLAKSRTFGGRNNPQQIQKDAANLYQAAVQDFNVLAKSWSLAGWTDVEIANMWQELHNARQQFFDTGEMQAGSMS